MKKTQRSWIRVAGATLGVCALTVGAGMPAFAEEGAVEVADLAVDKYEAAAAQIDTSVDDVKQREEAGEILIAETGNVAFIDPAPEFTDIAELAVHETAAAAIPGTPAGGSLPGAPVTIFLDFDGHSVSNTGWNTKPGSAPTMNFAGAPGVNQALVWAAVAEDYAPFNINVVVDNNPSADALTKSSMDDANYGSHVVVTDSYTELFPYAANSGGIAFLDAVGSPSRAPAFVFTAGLGGGDPTAAADKSVAEAASHEAGHNFGLEHDGIGSHEYFSPDGGLWGPVMGATYHAPLSQWSHGEYADATNTGQDDVATITNRSAATYIFRGATLQNGDPFTGGQVCVLVGDPQNPKPGDQFQVVNPDDTCGELLVLNFDYVDRADYRADTVGNDAASATALDNATGTATASNVILTSGDVDVYSFTTIGGAFSAEVEVANVSPNLDSKLTLSKADGTVVAENSPATTRSADDSAQGLGAQITQADLAAGNYFLTVDGVGQGDPGTAVPAGTDAYTDYGSLGNYTLNLDADPFVVDPIVIETPADGAEIAKGSVPVTGTAEPGAQVTLTVGGATFGPFTANDQGAWSGSIDSVYGNNVIVASQTVDGIAVSVTDTVTAKVPVPAPAITAPANGAEINSVTIWGTGIPGAVVTVAYTTGNGAAELGTATVDADGNWTLTPSGLAAGDYTITATQTINGVTSPVSNEVSFKILANGNAGGGNAGGNGNGNNLPNTGSDSGFAALGFGALGLLLVGGALTVVAARKRNVSAEI